MHQIAILGSEREKLMEMDHQTEVEIFSYTKYITDAVTWWCLQIRIGIQRFDYS